MSRKWKKNGYADPVLNKSKTSNFVPWQEWSDIELNGEQWDYPKGGVFTDPEQIIMPRSLEPFEWKRFGELSYIDSPVVYEAISGYPDLITKNRHIMHSEFIRCFISTMINLQYCGRYGLEIENPNTNFSWNYGDQCWQGWYNVYSLNKAGRGVSHRPVINRNGKYIVRIFHMGCWRRIFIDDFIPVDKNNRSLLPHTSNVNELWPMILAKATLKIASLSWSVDREILDCSLITCLTGWIELSLDVTHLSPNDQWEFFLKYTKHFELPRDSLKDQAKSDMQEKSGKSRKSKNTSAKHEAAEESRSILLFASLKNTRNADIEKIPGITPCWEHQVYVELSREVPLDSTELKAPLEKWKNYRWLQWAIRRGLVEGSDFFMPVRYLLLMSPLGRYRGNIMDDYDDIDDSEEEGEAENHPSETHLRQGNKNETDNQTDLSRTKNRDFQISDISVWEDFNKLSHHLREIHLFYRQKFFKYNIQVSDSAKFSSINDGKKSVSENTIKDVKKNSVRSSGATGNLEKVYEYQDKISKSRNEPLYLFIDSVHDKLILLNFSTVIHDDTCDSKKSSLVIERHDWFESIIDDGTIGVLKTRGTKSMVFQLKPGRHLLRIFINFQSTYRAILLSDTAFEIGDRLKMHRLMIAEAHRVEKVARKVSDSVTSAFESFGTSNYSIDLKKLYRSYMPASSITLKHSNRRLIKSIHNFFTDEFWKMIEKRFSAEELPSLRRAMRIFLLDFSFGIKSARTSDNHEKIQYQSDEEETSSSDRFARTIQSFFRMAVTKRYKAIHEPRHDEHHRTKETLRRIAEIFNYEGGQYGANTLLREIMKCDENIETLYTWTSDMKYVINVEEFGGRVTNFTSDRWFPIIRAGVNTERFENVFAGVNLFTDVTHYAVRMFDNDDNLEMPRVGNHVTPNHYSFRENGYTIFAHGFNDLQGYKEVEWLLHLITIRGHAGFRSFNETPTTSERINIPPLYIREISNTYVPNVQNRIFKLILGVGRKMRVSLRLKTSYEKVLAKLRVAKENDEASWEIEGRGNSILPVVFLDADAWNVDEIDSGDNLNERKVSMTRKSGASLSQRSATFARKESVEGRKVFGNITRYIVEAHVLDDSWPLTAEEWSVVMESKLKDSTNTDKPDVHPKPTVSGRKSQRSRTLSKKSLDDLRKPHWSLQIVTDFENEPEVIRDTGKEEKIADFRKMGKSGETGCADRGKKLRQIFLDENSLMIAQSGIDLDGSASNNEDIVEKNESLYSFENEMLTLNKRTHEPPGNLANYLPKLDLTIYMEKEDEEEDRWVKSEFDEETLRNLRAMNFLDFEQSQLSFLEGSSLFMETTRTKYNSTVRRYLENRDIRARNFNKNRLVRQAYVGSTKNTATSVKSKDSTKSKKGR